MLRQKDVIRRRMAIFVAISFLFSNIFYQAAGAFGYGPGAAAYVATASDAKKHLPGFTYSLHWPSEGNLDEKYGREIVSDDIVSLKDTILFVVRKLGALTDEDAPDEQRISAGFYYVTLPEEFRPVANGFLELEENGFVYARVKWQADSREILIEFIDTEIMVAGHPINILSAVWDMYFGFECRLVKEAMQADDEGRVDIEMPDSDGNMDFYLKEGLPSGPELSKEGVWLGDNGTIQWEITYHAAAAAYYNTHKDTVMPVLLRDMIPEGQELDIESIEADEGLVVRWDSEQLLIWLSEFRDVEPVSPGNANPATPSDAIAGGEYHVRFRTKLTREQLAAIWANPKGTYVFSNRIQAVGKDNNPVDGLFRETSVEIPQSWPGRQLLTKKGVVHGSGQTREIQWTIMVDTAGYEFETLILDDMMGKGLIPNPDSIYVTDEYGNDLSACVVLTEIPDSSGKTRWLIDLLGNTAGYSMSGIYIITYTSQIDPDYFEQTKSHSWVAGDVSNSSSLEYQWTDDPEDTIVHSPAVTVNSRDMGLDNALVTKSVQGYDSRTHTITWLVHLNPNHVYLTSVHLMDQLSVQKGRFNHVFVSEQENGVTKENAIDAIRDSILKGLTQAGLTDSRNLAVEISEKGVLDIRLGEI